MSPDQLKYFLTVETTSLSYVHHHAMDPDPFDFDNTNICGYGCDVWLFLQQEENEN